MGFKVSWEFDLGSNETVKSPKGRRLMLPQLIEPNGIGNRTRKVKKVQHLRIALEAIKLATSNFSKGLTYSFDSYSLYEVELECIDREYLFGSNTENKDQLPKRIYNVLIKHIKDEERMFETEIEIRSTCRHRNIDSSFLGFCDEGLGMFLVFEIVPDLQIMSMLGRHIFTWEKRLKVCLDIAQGLYYLHSRIKDQKKVIHRDLRSYNIYLVEKSNHLEADSWEASITGFQHAVLLTQNQHDDTLILDDTQKMTFYTDPEYAKSGDRAMVTKGNNKE
ncbi:receptor-like protein kinase HERK 1 [Rutidosis leptorrhynchoides]|uniref:receptor-like protein kinase HERK 1 n=1 Tax=Rutidosis leptorrhynchoides TaxID=125765 RepID=UPI003A9942BD